MKLAKLIKTASPEATGLALSSLFMLLIKMLILNRIPAAFEGANELGTVVEAVLASVIASYVFYFLVVHVKEQSDQNILQPYIEKHAKHVIGSCMGQLADISKASNTSIGLVNISKSNVTLAFSHIGPYSQAPLIISPDAKQYANWFQYFSFYEMRTKESIRKLLDQMIYIDAEMVSIITAIDDCSHFSQVGFLQNVQINNPDLTALASTFCDYCLLCRQLNAHLVRRGFSSALT